MTSEKLMVGVTLMAMLLVILVILERFIGVLVLSR